MLAACRHVGARVPLASLSSTRSAGSATLYISNILLSVIAVTVADIVVSTVDNVYPPQRVSCAHYGDLD